MGDPRLKHRPRAWDLAGRPRPAGARRMGWRTLPGAALPASAGLAPGYCPRSLRDRSSLHRPVSHNDALPRSPAMQNVGKDQHRMGEGWGEGRFMESTRIDSQNQVVGVEIRRCS